MFTRNRVVVGFLSVATVITVVMIVRSQFAGKIAPPVKQATTLGEHRIAAKAIEESLSDDKKLIADFMAGVDEGIAGLPADKRAAAAAMRAKIESELWANLVAYKNLVRKHVAAMPVELARKGAEEINQYLAKDPAFMKESGEFSDMIVAHLSVE